MTSFRESMAGMGDDGNPRAPRPWIAAALPLLLAACGDSSAAGEVLRFSAIPDQDTTELGERYDLLARHLSDRLGVAVEYWHASDYTASVEAFKNGDVQLAWFGGVTGVQAREAVDGARAIAQGRVDQEFVTYFVAHRDAGIEPGEDFPMAMQGKTFTFGPQSSTSGRLMPEFFIRQSTGRSPEEFFGHPNRYSATHTWTAKQVEAGTIQCGALNYKVYDDMLAAGELDPTLCVKVWTTPPYADYNWTAHPLLEERFGEGFTARLQSVLVSIGDPLLLKALQRPEGLIPATDEDFASIKETMLNVGLLEP